jgi:hypothetical protein
MIDRIDPGQGHTRWALEQTLTSLLRHLPSASGTRRTEMQAEIDALKSALADPQAEKENG